MKWFWGFLRKYRFKLLGGLILTTFISVLAIVNPYVSGMIVDDVIQGGQYDLLWKLVLILLLVTLVRGALRFFIRLFSRYARRACSTTCGTLFTAAF